jgi:para-aminobenzoate synthetase component 1
MITDLIRNDLSFLNDFSSRVVHEKQPLAVPGILHQYSLITTKVEKQLSLFETIEALFPGGSITGAPKKRVMELIKNIEKNKRGFYCGSTILLIGAHKSASINIRSCTIDFVSKKLEYGTGGGVTLLSKLSCEFEESKLKLSSFIKLLN